MPRKLSIWLAAVACCALLLHACYAVGPVILSTNAVDSTAPTVSTVTIPAAGTTMNVAFSEAVVGTENLGWSITASGGAVTVSSGVGTGTGTFTLTLSRAIEDTETVTLDYSSSTGNIADASANDLATFSGQSVDNNSTHEDPAVGWTDEDSFEGTPPTFWDTGVFATTNIPGSQPVAQTTEGGVPTGGGTYAMRQWWNTGTNRRTDWLYHNLDTSTTDEGDVFTFEYYLKYHANFDTNNSNIKSIILRNGAGDQECYINSHNPGAGMRVLFQQTTDTFHLYANVNGGSYTMPLGEWVHFRWEIKVATQTSGDPRDGYVKGWVNDTLRWDHQNINTIYTGQYTEINTNSTFNEPVYGNDQKRYWDLWKIGVP